ncbi:MAG: CDP-alcohol phosphatidyltransferase family protein [Streptosporangiaceae bacterium]
MTYSLADVRETLKPRDSWWTVLLVDPVAIRLTRFTANRTRLTPSEVTVGAFLLGLAAAACFATNRLVAGALLYHCSFILDCVDGKLARLKGAGSPFGGWLDYMLDRVRVACCAAALAGGQYLLTGDHRFLVLGVALVLVDLFRYLNGLQVGKARRRMLAEPEVETMSFTSPVLLRRHRVRMRLVSGVEFQMAAFIVAPLTGLIIPVTVLAGGVLVFFECVLIVQFWRQARAYSRVCQPAAERVPAAR